MKITTVTKMIQRGLVALTLCGVGFVVLLISLATVLSGFIKDTPSDPNPTTGRIIGDVALGAILLASSGACFALARRVMVPLLPQTPANRRGSA